MSHHHVAHDPARSRSTHGLAIGRSVGPTENRISKHVRPLRGGLRASPAGIGSQRRPGGPPPRQIPAPRAPPAPARAVRPEPPTGCSHLSDRRWCHARADACPLSRGVESRWREGWTSVARSPPAPRAPSAPARVVRPEPPTGCSHLSDRRWCHAGADACPLSRALCLPSPLCIARTTLRRLDGGGFLVCGSRSDRALVRARITTTVVST